MDKRSILIFSIILILAFVFRFYQLGSNPPGFFRDEADKGYTSYSLLKTGQDQAGNHWAFFVKALKVTTSALYQYLDISFIASLGMNEVAVRLPACIAGTLSVGAVFLMARLWWGVSAGLWAAVFVCLSPWSILLSRWANQSILLTLWIPLGVYCFVKGMRAENPKPRYIIVSAIFFLAALYTYAPARLFVPVFIFLLWLVVRWTHRYASVEWAQAQVGWAQERSDSPPSENYFDVKIFLIFWGIFIIGSIPLAYHLLFEQAESAARLSKISIFDDRPLIFIAKDFFINYLLHLSPDFLFTRGDENLRHHTSVFGQVHWYLFPLLLLGLWKAIRERTFEARILLIWFFSFPLAAACTQESIPHALRSVFAVPVIQLVSVYGLFEFTSMRSGFERVLSKELIRAFKVLWLVILVLFPALYLYDLYARYPKRDEVAFAWEYGYREAIGWWKEHREGVDQTVVSGMAEYPYTFFLFYDRYPPQKWIETGRIDGVTFVPTGHPINSYLQKTGAKSLYLARPDEVSFVQPEKVIYTPGGIAIWKWIEWGGE